MASHIVITAILLAAGVHYRHYDRYVTTVIGLVILIVTPAIYAISAIALGE